MKNTSLNIDIDRYGNMSVVPIRCGKSRGTAFFVGSNQLLTAKHIIGSHIKNPIGCDIQVCINDEWYDCSVSFVFTKADVVLLNCSINEPDGNRVKIVSSDCPSGEDLLVLGFPEEIGNGIDYFGVRVRNSRHLRKDNKDDLSRGFNVVVVRTDLLEFASYSGFSGSPVLNSKAEVVGIATDQFYNSLGYTSIRMLVDEFDFANVGLDVKTSNVDTTQFGITKAAEILQDKLKKAGERYSPKTHVEDTTTNDYLSAFCNIGINEIRAKVLNLCKQIYISAKDELKDYLNNEGKGKKLKTISDTNELSYELLYELEDIQYYKPEHSDECALKNPLRKDVENAYDLLSKILDLEHLEKTQILYVTGNAGQGKTHTLCHFADVNKAHNPFYLFFGTEFGKEDPLDTILASLQWAENDLERLNKYMVCKNQYAIFIIDAINEGGGTEFWKTKLNDLKDEFIKHDRLKLILSLRTMPETDELKDLLKDGENLDIAGFRNTRDAIQIHFEKSNITENPSDFVTFSEFQSPLYLKIFCEAYNLLHKKRRQNLTRDIIYFTYLRKRNIEISRLVDEDPTKQVTWKYVKEIAQTSVDEVLCLDIPREKALDKANEICSNRLWSHNLMNILLKESILKEYSLKDGRKLIGFEFDSMGDYLKMCHLKNKSDQLIVGYISHVFNTIFNNNYRLFERSHFSNVITFLFSEWSPSEFVWNNILSHKVLKKYFIYSMSFRKGDTDYSKILNPILNHIIEEEPVYSSPSYLLDNFNTYKFGVIYKVHENLLSLNMSERDLRWTVAVNEVYSRYGAMSRFNSLFDTQLDFSKEFAMLVCWFCTTSHPSFHAQLVMVLRNVFTRDLSLIKTVAKCFEMVDDPYVTQGIFAAGYAALVLKRNVEKCKEVAEYIMDKYYRNTTDAPSDVVVRIWTLKIIELAHILDDSYNGWNKVLSLLPFNSVEDPFANINHAEIRNEEYFGTTAGAHSLKTSLFEWDFNRYILGTNNNNYSPIFASLNRPIYKINDICHNGDVKIDDVADAIAKLIHDKYKYTDELGSIDKSSYEGRYNNEKERIGKKYQWIGYFEVLSYLCDHYKIVLDRWGANTHFADHSFPWLTGKTPHFDPTIGIEESLSILSREMFAPAEEDIIIIDNPEEWSIDIHKMPSMKTILKDYNDNEWIFLSAFDKQSVVAHNMTCSVKVWYNTVFVANSDQGKFEEWCKSVENSRQDFYSSSEYEYHWNDYPYSSAYKDRTHEQKYDWSVQCDVNRTTVAQLQEDFIGCLSQSEFLRESEAPNTDMMSYLKLHTAERGVIKNEKNEIAAININSTSDRMSGLVIKRELLNAYLNYKQYKIYYYVTVEKNAYNETETIGNKIFNAVWRYETNESPADIVPLKVSAN